MEQGLNISDGTDIFLISSGNRSKALTRKAKKMSFNQTKQLSHNSALSQVCCICKKEFSTDDELANHLLDHTEESTFKNELGQGDLRSDNSSRQVLPPKPFRVFPEFTRTSMVRNQTPRKSIVPRPVSPEVWEILSDDSDDDNGKKSSKTTNVGNKIGPVTKLSGAKLISGQSNGTRRFSLTNGLSRQKSQNSLNSLSRQNSQNSLSRQNSQNCLSRQNSQNSLSRQPNSQNSLSRQPNIQNSLAQIVLPNVGVQGFKCNLCAKVFTNAKALNEHISTMHNKKDVFTCQICYKTFSYKSTLRQHLYLHVREKEHICSICNKGFTLKSQLRKHYSSHVGARMPQKTLNQIPPGQ